MSGAVHARAEGAIGWLVLDNPARRNALSQAMWRGIGTGLDALEADPCVRVIVLRGSGVEAFAAGADISEFETLRADAAAARAYAAVSDEAQERLYRCPKPTIAMIHGFCIGGGMGLALDCDLRVAGASARFGVPAARLGLGYPAKHIARLVDVVGQAQAREIFFTARHYAAEEALRIGLANRLVPDAALEAEVRSLAEGIAANAPVTIGAVKAILLELARIDGPADAARCTALYDACFDSADYAEGRRAFMEKRRPVFRGA